MRWLYVLFVFSIPLCLLAQETASNPYQLPLTSTLYDYLTEVGDNEDNSLINLQKVIPDLVIDIKYATANNFTHEVIYTEAIAYLRQSVAKALYDVQQALDSLDLALKVFDAYRPYQATLRFYEVFPDIRFVAPPWKGSVHNRAAAVDVTLIYKQTGNELEMPTAFDAFTVEAAPDYAPLPANIEYNRNLLISVMQRYGFKVNPSEWWHYDYRTSATFSLLDLSFEQLKSTHIN